MVRSAGQQSPSWAVMAISVMAIQVAAMGAPARAAGPGLGAPLGGTGVDERDVGREGESLAGRDGGAEAAYSVGGIADVEEHAVGRGAVVEGRAEGDGERRDQGRGAFGAGG
jgi:hypothetical protein